MVNTISKISPLKCILIILLISISCRTISLKGEDIKKTGEGEYFIEVDTILEELTNENSQVFFYPSHNSELIQKTVQWSEKDYFAVANNFFKFKWEESVGDWEIRIISFGSRCEHVSDGAQNALYIFYRIENSMRVERTVYIDPYNNSIKWSESEFSPSIVTQNPIQNNDTVTLKEILRIAEDSGGRDIRLSNNNECIININLIDSGRKWLIAYVKTLALFEIEINSVTGEYLILNK